MMCCVCSVHGLCIKGHFNSKQETSLRAKRIGRSEMVMFFSFVEPHNKGNSLRSGLVPNKKRLCVQSASVVAKWLCFFLLSNHIIRATAYVRALFQTRNVFACKAHRS